jgi:hypothetical protein
MNLCKTCFKWKNHQKLTKENNCGENCNQCISYKIHMNEVKTVQQYRNETSAQILSSNAENNLPKLLVVSADTQKILQIPKMPIKDKVKPLYLEHVDNWFLKLVLYNFNEYVFKNLLSTCSR